MSDELEETQEIQLHSTRHSSLITHHVNFCVR
jgi:hypothetical protein